jgi:hypothetical protein
VVSIIDSEKKKPSKVRENDSDDESSENIKHKSEKKTKK